MRYAVAHLDELEALPGPDTLTWRPVRAHFDLRAFGCNAYTAAEAGQDVVEPHDEAGDPGHEELYFVHAGRARFTLDGCPSSANIMRALARLEVQQGDREAALGAARHALELVADAQREELRADMRDDPTFALVHDAL